MGNSNGISKEKMPTFCKKQISVYSVFSVVPRPSGRICCEGSRLAKMVLAVQHSNGLGKCELCTCGVFPRFHSECGESWEIRFVRFGVEW